MCVSARWCICACVCACLISSERFLLQETVGVVQRLITRKGLDSCPFTFYCKDLTQTRHIRPQVSLTKYSFFPSSTIVSPLFSLSRIDYPFFFSLTDSHQCLISSERFLLQETVGVVQRLITRKGLDSCPFTFYCEDLTQTRHIRPQVSLTEYSFFPSSTIVLSLSHSLASTIHPFFR